MSIVSAAMAAAAAARRKQPPKSDFLNGGPNAVSPPGAPKPPRTVSVATARPPVVRQPANTHIIPVPDPLADFYYKGQAAALSAQQRQYNQQAQHGLAQYNQTAAQQITDLGYRNGKWDKTNTDPGTYGAALRDVSNDYTTRGMGYSSPFITATQNMQNDYANRLGKINTAKTQNTNTVNDQIASYTAQNQQQLQQARRDAIGRIAGRLGIQPTQVTPGRSSTVTVPNA